MTSRGRASEGECRQFGYLSAVTATEDLGFQPRGVVRMDVTLGRTGAIDELVFSR